MANRDIIVIGASYGGVEVLAEIVRAFPPNLKAAVFIVLHTAARYSVLPAILQRNCMLPVEHADDDETIRMGRVYVAPPDRHMLIRDGRIELSAGAKENNHRPAIDSTFRTAAAAYGNRVIACVLTGYLDDGTSGLLSVKRAGGMAIVQDPENALAPSMPNSALEFVDVDHTLPSDQIGPKLVELSGKPVPVSSGQAASAVSDNGHGTPPEQKNDQLTCPECQGSLVPLEEHGLLRFRCRTGHVYSQQSLDEAQYDNLEKALWAAYRLLAERVALLEKLYARSRDRGQSKGSKAYLGRIKNAQEQAAAIEHFLQGLSRSQPVEELD